MTAVVLVVLVHANLYALIYELMGPRALLWFAIGDAHMFTLIVVVGSVVTISRRQRTARTGEKLNALRELVNKPVR